MGRARPDSGREVSESLVAAARSLDPQALAELCEHFYPKIYRYILPRVASREDAEDLAGEVFVRVMKSLPRQKGFFPAWLYRIARNLVTDYYRRRGVRQETVVTEEHASSEPDPTDGTERAEVQDLLERTVRRLTPEQQEVIRLKFVEGYDTSEIASIQGKSVGAVRAIQFRALKALRDHLSPKDVL